MSVMQIKIIDSPTTCKFYTANFGYFKIIIFQEFTYILMVVLQKLEQNNPHSNIMIVTLFYLNFQQYATKMLKNLLLTKPPTEMLGKSKSKSFENI